MHLKFKAGLGIILGYRRSCEGWEDSLDLLWLSNIWFMVSGQAVGVEAQQQQGCVTLGCGFPAQRSHHHPLGQSWCTTSTLGCLMCITVVMTAGTESTVPH